MLPVRLVCAAATAAIRNGAISNRDNRSIASHCCSLCHNVCHNRQAEMRRSLQRDDFDLTRPP